MVIEQCEVHHFVYVALEENANVTLLVNVNEPLCIGWYIAHLFEILYSTIPGITCILTSKSIENECFVY